LQVGLEAAAAFAAAGEAALTGELTVCAGAADRATSI
jgi:thiamine pyrophosphate-dependent acetolactate synthase large subunit-like protein